MEAAGARPTERYLFLPVLRQLPLRKRKIVRELSKTCFLILGKPGGAKGFPLHVFNTRARLPAEIRLIKPYSDV